MSKEYSLLLVEDEKNILYGMKNVLACTLNRLSEVLTAENGKEALDVIEMAHPDMIITDLRMPEMDGIALVKEIRARQYTMPIIVLTAIADFQAIKSLIPYGIQNYILKPFSVEDILKETQAAVQKLDEAEKVEQVKKLMTEHPELLDQQEYHGKSELVFQAQTYIQTYIKEHLKEGTTLASLAEYLHVSKSYLSTLFKQEAGMTVMEYITCARMKEAKRLLLHTDMRVCEIYEEIGYQSDKYFIAVFKSIEGITPLAFRKKYQLNSMD